MNPAGRRPVSGGDGASRSPNRSCGCSLRCSVGQAVVSAGLDFGHRDRLVHATIAGDLPLAGDAAGCDAVSLTVVPKNRIKLLLTACKRDTGDRVTWSLDFPNRVGKVALALADVEASFTTRKLRATPAVPSCSGDCGLWVEVLGAWGPSGGLQVAFDGRFRKSTDGYGSFSTFILSGTVSVSTPETTP